MARRLGKPLMPWQQYAADVALEIDPESGELWYEEVVITVPRQSGKTTLILAILVWRCIIMARRLGSQTCTYLAQSGKMARRKLEREFAPILMKARTLVRIPPESRRQPVKANEWKLSMNNGSENIYFGTGSYLQIEAPTGTGSHGDVLDMPVIDEAFAHEDDLVEQAVDAATVTRRSPQSYVVSTAGNERSRFLARKVLGGRKACLDGASSRSCFLEWSVPDDEPFDDPEVWAQYLPALGHTITVQRLLARLDKAQRNPDEVDEDGYEPGIAGFRRGYMNQWPKWPPLGADGHDRIVPADAWAQAGVVDGVPVGARALAWEVSPDRSWSSVGWVGRRDDGSFHGEIVESKAGVDWVPARLAEYASGAGSLVVAVGVDPGAPAGALLPDVEAAFKSAGLRLGSGEGGNLIKVSGQSDAAACGDWFDKVTTGQFRHINQGWLNSAVDNASWVPSGKSRVLDRKNAKADITSLCLVVVALRALQVAPAQVDDTGGFTDLEDLLDDDDDGWD